MGRVTGLPSLLSCVLVLLLSCSCFMFWYLILVPVVKFLPYLIVLVCPRCGYCTLSSVRVGGSFSGLVAMSIIFS